MYDHYIHTKHFQLVYISTPNSYVNYYTTITKNLIKKLKSLPKCYLKTTAKNFRLQLYENKNRKQKQKIKQFE